MHLALGNFGTIEQAWVSVLTEVDAGPSHEAHNVIFSVEAPSDISDASMLVRARVSHALNTFGCKPLSTVANTIFPHSLYRRHGWPEMVGVFRDRVLPVVRRNRNWSGYYFDRLTCLVSRDHPGQIICPLDDLVQRLQIGNAKHKFEISVFDPERDLSRSPYGGQCMSHMSFHLVDGRLSLTAIYRNHFYVEKLLGNLLGLARLLEFATNETGLEIGHLDILSTHAQIDQPKKSGYPAMKRADIEQLISDCQGLLAED
jgi:hypothetical protein